MPHIAVYYEDSEIELLLNRLNEDEEVAWIVSNGPRRWKAQKSIDWLQAKQYAIWHIPSGALPLDWEKSSLFVNTFVEDPREGWTEKRRGSDSSIPYFGAGHPGVFWIDHTLTRLSLQLPDSVKQVNLSWIGSHYSIVHPFTQKWWQRMQRWVRKTATLDKTLVGSVLAFPLAYQTMKEAGLFIS